MIKGLAKKNQIQVIILLMVISFGMLFISIARVDGKDFYFTLKSIYFGNHKEAGDYFNLLKNQLAQIGINLDISYIEWPMFEWWVIIRAYDLFYTAFTGYSLDPDFTGVYNENGSLNIFGYDESLDWDPNLILGDRTGWGMNEWYMKKGTLMMPPDSQERINHYWAWEQHLMDRVLPCQPIFTQKQTLAHWANLKGYNLSNGLLQSWGKMSWQGAHDGQLNTTEVVIADKPWFDLNPLFQDERASRFISSAILDPLIWYDADASAWPHLAKSYTMINDTHVRIVARDGIYWAEDPDNMSDHKPFTIKDVYFTLYAWKTISNDIHLFDWIKDLKIVDNKTMDIFIDGDNLTPENEPYARFLPALSLYILPEFYLNQTQLLDGKTPDITNKSWEKYATNAFGTSFFEIADFKEEVETTLKVRNDCWWMNESITSASELNWIKRFGDFSGSINQLRIRIIADELLQIEEFNGGKLDLIDASNYPIRGDEYCTDPSKIIQSKFINYFGFLMYNLRPTRTIIGSREPCPFDPTISKGLAIRKAISYAMNREEINNVVHGGKYLITDYPIYPTLGIWCNPNIIRYDHDLEKAKEYMAMAGYGLFEPTTSITSFQIATSFLIISTIAVVIIQLKDWKKWRSEN